MLGLVFLRVVRVHGVSHVCADEERTNCDFTQSQAAAAASQSCKNAGEPSLGREKRQTERSEMLGRKHPRPNRSNVQVQRFLVSLRGVQTARTCIRLEFAPVALSDPTSSWSKATAIKMPRSKVFSDKLAETSASKAAYVQPRLSSRGLSMNSE